MYRHDAGEFTNCTFAAVDMPGVVDRILIVLVVLAGSLVLLSSLLHGVTL